MVFLEFVRQNHYHYYFNNQKLVHHVFCENLFFLICSTPIFVYILRCIFAIAMVEWRLSYWNYMGIFIFVLNGDFFSVILQRRKNGFICFSFSQNNNNVYCFFDECTSFVERLRWRKCEWISICTNLLNFWECR